MAIVATGGYGRGVLAAGSDIDLLFLLPYKQTAWGKSVAETILYCLWDMGLKVGHATRSVNECIRQAKADMTVRTALLEARLSARRPQALRGAGRPIRQGGRAGHRRGVRRRQAGGAGRTPPAGGQSRYLVEPNVKDGKGGLRDLHTLYWIAKYVYRVREREELIEHGVYDPREYRRFRRCGDFLWAVRCTCTFSPDGRRSGCRSTSSARCGTARLHRASGLARRRTLHEALLPDRQGRRRSHRHPVRQAREQSGQADAGAEPDDGPIPAADTAHADRDRGFRRRLQPHQGSRRERVHARPDQSDPHLHLAQKYNLALHPDAMHMATRSLKLIDQTLRENEDANQQFLEILTSKNDSETVLRRMNEAGVLGRFVPAFGRIVAMMQFNMYHHYTVDEHLLRCIGVLSDIEAGRAEDAKFATELMHTIQPRHRELLYVALFLHDIAKGRIEDHSIAGARVARHLCPRLGFSAAETETVAWLIEVHLVMSSVAQSRDLSDRMTIENFSAVVQSVERMKLLTILTTADIKAVGPGVWNGWKAQLIRTLYYETEPVLTGGFSEVNRAQRVAMAQAEFRAEITDWTPVEIDQYIALHYPAYWLKVDLQQKVAHARFLRAAAQEGKSLATTVSFPAARGVTELTVVAPDHPWLLSIIAGACAVAGANIVDAQIFTTTDGSALDTIAVSREFEHDEDEARRATRIANSIEKALRGDLRLPEVVAKRAPAKPRLKAFAVQPEVTVNNGWSNRYTMVEVTGLDRPGLLFELTATLSKLNLNIASAHVATFGERVVDVFYVTDLFGAKITSPTRHATIKRALIGLLSPAHDTTAEPAKRRGGRVKRERGRGRPSRSRQWLQDALQPRAAERRGVTSP